MESTRHLFFGVCYSCHLLFENSFYDRNCERLGYELRLFFVID